MASSSLLEISSLFTSMIDEVPFTSSTTMGEDTGVGGGAIVNAAAKDVFACTVLELVIKRLA
eukprot:970059-Prymnesium_polylepis.1